MIMMLRLVVLIQLMCSTLSIFLSKDSAVGKFFFRLYSVIAVITRDKCISGFQQSLLQSWPLFAENFEQKNDVAFIKSLTVRKFSFVIMQCHY